MVLGGTRCTSEESRFLSLARTPSLLTATFRVLYVFIVLRHDRREVVHFNVTTNPYAQRAAQQIINAFPYEEAPLSRLSPTFVTESQLTDAT